MGGHVQTNFTQLYSQLDLSPDCSPEDLKRAYRRRIAELHPDRRDGDGRSPETAGELRELISQYVAATRFHRRHGRLPGGSPRHVAPIPVGATVAPARTAPYIEAPSTHRSAGLFALLVALLLLLLVLGMRDDGSEQAGVDADVSTNLSTTSADGLPDAESQTPTAFGQAPGEEPLPDQLEIGMDVATVRAIQGEPVRSNDTDWEYGPSWLRFAHNRLIAWHSSPLHPLKTATPSPPPLPESEPR